MLESLSIKNMALIDEIQVNFSQNLNILSGETGAGKSIIIDSIGFVLGERASKDFIRKGEDSAFVEAVFYVGDNAVVSYLNEAGIDVDEEGKIIIYRTVDISGKSSARINGRAVTVGMLRDITAFFIDIHSQHENQTLLNSKKHIDFVDKFCDEKLDSLKKELKRVFVDYRKVIKDINYLSGDRKDRREAMDLLQFQIKELSSANLKVGEEEELQERKKILAGSEKLASSAAGVLELLDKSDLNELSALDKIGKSISFLQDIAGIDESKTVILKTIESMYAELQEVVVELQDYFGEIEFDPVEIDNIETRLHLIYSLKKKYGNSVKEMLEHLKSLKEKYDFIENSREKVAELQKEKKLIEEKMISICGKMTEERKKGATKIKNEIVDILKELGMKDVRFDISFEKKNVFSLNGFDDVEFMISPNKGESLKPLSKTASGGEMSRIMFALKIVLADVYGIEAFIFDEIDTGVSGRTAQKVAEKLADLSKKYQILCITHLPQIAAMADRHFLIEKGEKNGRTVTEMILLDSTGEIKELSRLTSGAKTTDATVKAAEEIKYLADKYKLDK